MFFLAGVLSFSSVSAQTPDSIKSGRPNSLKPGAWALQFQITENFTLRDFQGFLISAKRHSSAKRAIRFGLGISGNVSDVDFTSTILQNDSVIAQDGEHFDFKNGRFEVVAQFISYPSPNDEVNFFVGAGPLIRLAYSEFSSPRDSSIEKTNESSGGFGASGVFGVEWFVTRRISFLAEYGVSFLYAKLVREVTQKELFGSREEFSEISEISSTRFEPLAVKFGLTLYFSRGKKAREDLDF